MKKKTFEYVYPKSLNYLSAAIEVNGYYLVLRNADKRVFRRLGYFFPGCKANAEYENTLYLREQLKKKYKFDVTVNNIVGDVLVKDKTRLYSCLYLYKCTLNSRIKSSIIEINGVKLIVEFHKPEEFRHMRFDHADKLLAQRINVFKRIMNVSFEEAKRTKAENDAALVMYDSLLYFEGRIAKQDILDFASLVKTNASLKEIKIAYNWIISRHKVNVREYLKWVKRNKKIRRKQKWN